MADPWQVLTSSQKKAMGLVSEAFDGVVKLGRDAVTQPEEALQRLTTLVAAVGDLAASSTKPMESLLASQRNLANAMTAFAQLQTEMAEVVERLAASHNAVVDALEKLAGPVLSVSELIRSEPVVEKAQQRAKKK
jgi:enamine deaminase RidA (YjgF/YER057c/UK114 family)